MKKSGYSESNLNIDWDELRKEGEQLAKVKPLQTATITQKERKILSLITANPGITYGQLIYSLGISSASSNNIMKLIEMKLIRKERKAQHTHYYPNMEEKKK